MDTDNYFRTQYGVHPLIQKFWTKDQQFSWFAVSGTLAMLAGIFALFYTNFSLNIIILFAIGAIVLLIYTWPLKHIALGEISIFLIWGPVMVAGGIPGAGERRYGICLAGGIGSGSVGVERGEHQPRQAY